MMHVISVRKHQAPKGALRRHRLTSGEDQITVGQKAPSAIRRIKTVVCQEGNYTQAWSSESTERHKVH